MSGGFQLLGGIQKLNCANTEGIFRIIQSIPSPKAEPFKRWLSKVGTEHPQGFEKNKQVSKRGGKIAGDARSNLEKETSRKVISSQNYLPKKQGKRLLK